MRLLLLRRATPVRMFKLKFLSAARLRSSAARDDYDAARINAGAVLFREEKFGGNWSWLSTGVSYCNINHVELIFLLARDFKILHVLFGLGIILFTTNMENVFTDIEDKRGTQIFIWKSWADIFLHFARNMKAPRKQFTKFLHA
jgi:hypothetical protein